MRRRVPVCIYLLKELLMTEIIRKGWCPKCNHRAGKVDMSIIRHDHGVGLTTGPDILSYSEAISLYE
jgi:hypothetical protein